MSTSAWTSGWPAKDKMRTQEFHITHGPEKAVRLWWPMDSPMTPQNLQDSGKDRKQTTITKDTCSLRFK